MGDSPEGDGPGASYFRLMEHTTKADSFSRSEHHAEALLEEGAAFGALAKLEPKALGAQREKRRPSLVAELARGAPVQHDPRDPRLGDR